jgi:hypothetical protein
LSKYDPLKSIGFRPTELTDETPAGSDGSAYRPIEYGGCEHNLNTIEEE